ncbi:MAG: hypothetical protein CMF69_04355 [Magnetovibrio sp.]|nr:hypothetical protein [Magnetovibrio sp.]
MTNAQERYTRYLETLTPKTLSLLSEYVTADVRFKDPFNDVRGVDEMARVFNEMFCKLGNVSFRAVHINSNDNICIIVWNFEATLRQKSWKFDGTSVITFNSDGRVNEHIDHWDAASNFYEHLPVIGWLLRSLRRYIANGS